MMNNLPADVWKLSILFVIMLLILHWLLIKILKLSKIGWKRIDYIWLSLAALGLISASAEVRNWLAARQVETEKIRMETQFSLLKNYIGEVEPPNYICTKFVRTEYSPDNIDEIQAEYDELCEWNKGLLAKLPIQLPPDSPDLKYSDYAPNKDPTNKILIEYLSVIRMYFSNYQGARNEYMALREASAKSELELLLFYLSPILLCLALALRITKVTGELNLAKREQS